MVKKVISLNDSTYVLGIDRKGLYFVNSDYEILNVSKHNENKESSLSGNGIYDIFKDENNRLWITTYDGGVNIYDPNILAFESINHAINKFNSLGNNYGRTVIEMTNGDLWFGTNRGISILNKKTNKWTQIFNNKKKKPLSENTVLSLCQVNEKEVWVGSYSGGIDVVNINTLKTKPLLPKEEFLKKIGSIYIYKILKDSEGNVWIGSIRGNLIKYSPDNKEFVQYSVPNIQNIYEGRNDKIYFGSRKGAYIYDKKTKAFNLLTKKKYNLSNDICLSFYEQDNILYIGTEGGGLNALDLATHKNTVYLIENGLPSNTVYDILGDENGNLWLGTTQGLSFFDTKTHNFVNYDTSDGLLIKEFNFGAATKTKDNSLIFGGKTGFVRFKPHEIKKINIPPTLFISDFKIFNKNVIGDSLSNPLKQNINITNEIELDYGQNSFSFDFIGINYTNPEKNVYSFKLESFETDWQPRTKNSTITYTNMEPGDYIFKLRASNVQGEWNSSVREIKIRVNPPFWRTKMAYVLYLLLIIAIIYWIIQFSRMKLQDKHSKEKIQFFANVAHDLRTPLTLIKSPLMSLDAKDYIHDSEKNLIKIALNNVDKLTNHFTQLLDFQKGELKKMQLQVDKHNIVSHLQKTISYFKPLIEKKELSIEFNFPDEDIELWYDRNKFDKAFYNLISNSIKYSNKNGKIGVKLYIYEKYLKIDFEDDGIGIPEKQQKEIFKRYYRASNAVNSEETGSGVGLLLVKQVLDLHKGKIYFRSKENEGTCFTLSILLDKKHFENTDFVSKTNSSEKVPVLKPIVSNSDALFDEKEGEEIQNTDKLVLLIVEDSSELLSFLANEFRDEFTVLQAQNGRIALEKIAETEPDIIVSDVMMPEMDGNTLCLNLKQNVATCHIPIILLTALANTDSKIESYDLGADSYIEKPFDLRILKSKIANLLKSRKVLKDKFLSSSNEESVISYKNELDNEFIEKSIAIVNKHMDNSEFSVEVFCKELFMSRPVVYRKLKALTDKSPQDFIKIIRLKKAAELIKQQRNTISEVAYSTGFSDPKYFSTSFKKFFGVSPSKFLDKK